MRGPAARGSSGYQRSLTDRTSTVCLSSLPCTPYLVWTESSRELGGFSRPTPGEQVLEQVPSMEPVCLLSSGSPVTLTDKAGQPSAASVLFLILELQVPINLVVFTSRRTGNSQPHSNTCHAGDYNLQSRSVTHTCAFLQYTHKLFTRTWSGSNTGNSQTLTILISSDFSNPHFLHRRRRFS